MSKKISHTSKQKKSSGDWHCSFDSMGMGDYYGTGIKNKVGKVRENTVGFIPVSPKKLRIPPTSLA